MHAAEIVQVARREYTFLRIAEDSVIKEIPFCEVRKKTQTFITLIVSIQRDGKSFVPKAQDALLPGDICYSMCYRDQVHELESLFQPSLSKTEKGLHIGQ